MPDRGHVRDQPVVEVGAHPGRLVQRQEDIGDLTTQVRSESFRDGNRLNRGRSQGIDDLQALCQFGTVSHLDRQHLRVDRRSVDLALEHPLDRRLVEAGLDHPAKEAVGLPDRHQVISGDAVAGL